MPSGELRFRRRDGEIVPEVPYPPAVSGDPVETLGTRHAAIGLDLRARTAMSAWLGERLDVGHAIEVLHPRARHAPPLP